MYVSNITSRKSLKDTPNIFEYLFAKPSFCNCSTYRFDIVRADGSTGDEVASSGTGRGVIVDARNGRSQRHRRWIPWLRTYGRIVERSGELSSPLVLAALLLLALAVLGRGAGIGPDIGVVVHDGRFIAGIVLRLGAIADIATAALLLTFLSFLSPRRRSSWESASPPTCHRSRSLVRSAST